MLRILSLYKLNMLKELISKPTALSGTVYKIGTDVIKYFIARNCESIYIHSNAPLSISLRREVDIMLAS